MEHEIPVTNKEQEQPEPKSAAPQDIPDQILELTEKLSRALDDFKQSEAYDRLLEKQEKVRDYIRKNPLPSLGYALATGVVLGFILKRSR